MTNPISKFTKQMRHKLHEVEQRLDALRVATEHQAEQAGKSIRKHVESLEDEAHKAKGKLTQANSDMAAWVEDTKESVADWKAKLDTRMLKARADRAEHYAEAAMVVALSGVDNAEKAMLTASVARHDAEVPHKA